MLWTLAQVYNKINRDLDLENEEIVQDAEFVEYVNDAVREVMAALLKLGAEDRYYLTSATISTVNGTDYYALPSNIYASKIVEIVYNDGSDIYKVKRVRGKDVFEDIAITNKYASDQDYFRYILVNTSVALGTRIKLVPTPLSSKSNAVTVWYIREATPLVEADLSGSVPVDCPEEFIQVVLAYVKYQCVKKEIGHPLTGTYKAEYDEAVGIMMQTLTDQTHDNDNTVILDTSFYADSV